MLVAVYFGFLEVRGNLIAYLLFIEPLQGQGNIGFLIQQGNGDIAVSLGKAAG